MADGAWPDAGLVSAATLAARLGLGDPIDQTERRGGAGRADVGIMAMTVVTSIMAGGDCS